MPFVKLDCKILDSTLWLDVEARDIFITALLMAGPWDTEKPMPQLDVNTMEPTGWEVPPGWYGFVPAAGPGIARRAGLDIKAGMAALVRLGATERESRSPSYEGRRLVRISGGFVVLNYMIYREKDTSALRQKRWREKQKGSNGVTPLRNGRHGVTVTQAEAEVEEDLCNNRTTNVRGRGVQGGKQLPPVPGARPRTELPPEIDFPLTTGMVAYLLAQAPEAEPGETWGLFRAWHSAHGSRMASWAAAWQVWCRREAGHGKGSNRAGRAKKFHAGEYMLNKVRKQYEQRKQEN